MATDNPTRELSRLRVLHAKLVAGTSSHFDEDEKGQLTKNTTAENIERLRLRIAELETQLTVNDNA